MASRGEQVFELPGGWEKKIVPRKSGASAGKWDTYLIAPDRTTIRSNQDLVKYCAATGTQIDPFVINMEKTNGKDKSAVNSRMKPSKGVTRLREALRRMSNSGQSLFSDNSFRGFTAPAAVTPSTSTSSGAEVSLLPTPRDFTARQVEYLERQYEKLEAFPTSKVFKFLARQLKVEQQHIEAWFKERNRLVIDQNGRDGDWKIEDYYSDYEKPVKKHCILDEQGIANIDVGSWDWCPETLECEIDPCDIVIEVDEEDDC